MPDIASPAKRIIVKGEDGRSGVDLETPADEITIKSQVQAGNPRFLDIILKCTEARRRILGLDAPANIRVDDGLENITAILTSRIERLNKPQP